MSKSKINVFWFRRDLRLNDNHGLFKALNEDLPVYPIFIFDTNIIDELPRDDARISFIYKQLNSINEELLKHNSQLHIYHGNPIEVWKTLMDKLSINAVYFNHDYEPYAIDRDTKVKELADENNIDCHSFKDHVIFEKNEVVKDDGNPYTVYTPYWRKWATRLTDKRLLSFESENLLHKLDKLHKSPFHTLGELGFEPSKIEVPDFDISKDLVKNYDKTRDIPSKDGTSRLGPHLRFGTISIRKCAKFAKAHNEVFLKELVWREFFMQILFQFPKVVDNNFREKYDAIKWRNDQSDFDKWKAGMTGYPMVDAGMRELNATGYMHNRVRMVVASFLCKHLLIDWRWGESYFAEKLLDYELSANNGNWQWAAGTGCDAAPYFRVFNPSSQLQKFDKELKYIKKWIPELDSLKYPNPMVDHKAARERALNTYKKALNQV